MRIASTRNCRGLSKDEPSSRSWARGTVLEHCVGSRWFSWLSTLSSLFSSLGDSTLIWFVWLCFFCSWLCDTVCVWLLFSCSLELQPHCALFSCCLCNHCSVFVFFLFCFRVLFATCFCIATVVLSLHYRQYNKSTRIVWFTDCDFNYEYWISLNSQLLS